MNPKKLVPLILLLIMAGMAVSLKWCKSHSPAVTKSSTGTGATPTVPGISPPANGTQNGQGFERNPGRLFFTKHARCRMACRHITQQEVKDILVNGNINYNKSELQDPRGPKYAVEGNTNDGQHVRIIFAPNTRHISVVTVIDLEEEFECNCN